MNKIFGFECLPPELIDSKREQEEISLLDMQKKYPHDLYLNVMRA